MTNPIEINISMAQLEKKAKTGKSSDIDFLLGNLHIDRSFRECKMIDYALGLVSNQEGIERISYYLFNGSRIQRNYAAMYFKRSGNLWIIEEAFQQGCIDEIQAYSR